MLPKLLVNSSNHFACVESCDTNEHIEMFNRCWKIKYLSNITDNKSDSTKDYINVLRSSRVIFASVIVPIVVCYMFLLFLYFYPKTFIWIILGFLTMSFIAITIYFCFIQIDGEDVEDHSKIIDVSSIFSVFFGLLSIIAVTISLCSRKKVKLIIQLYVEASKAIRDVPWILIIPIIVRIKNLEFRKVKVPSKHKLR